MPALKSLPLLLLPVLTLAPALAADVVGWRMDGDGRFPEATPPLEWSATENVAWKTKMPAWSNASPILIGGLQIIVLSEPDEILSISAADGTIQWRASTGDLVEDRPKAHDANGWTSPTPVSDGEHVFAAFGSGVVAAYGLDGERRWAKVLERPGHRWGSSASPLLAGGRLIVHIVDLVALDPATGRELWRAPSQNEWGSPVATTIGEVEVVLTPSGDVFKAEDGTKLASEIGRLRYAAPIVEDGVAYFIEKKATAVRLPASIDGRFEPLWQARVDGSRHYASSVLHQGRLYAISREQDFTILEAATGKVLDQQKLGLDDSTNGAYTSITLAGDKLYLSTENGVGIVAAAGETYEELARNRIEGLRSTPIFDGDRMYVRGFDYLYAFSAK